MTLEYDYINQANKAYESDNTSKALSLYKKAYDLNPKNEKIVFNIAMVFLKEKKYLKAIDYFQKAISLKLDYVNAYINLAIIYKRIEQYENSQESFLLALKYDDTNPEIYYNYANTLIRMMRYDEAISLLDKALELHIKDKSKAYYAKGLAYQNMSMYNEAMKQYDTSLSFNSLNYDTIFAISTIQLLYGDFKNAWVNYQTRWKASNELVELKYENTKAYTGKENLTNKKILVQQEQGYGDNIQFIRYIQKLVEQKAQVYLAIRNELHRFFSKIKGITLVKDKQLLSDIEYYVSILDLPRIFYESQDEFLYKDKYIDFIKEDIFEVKNKNKINIGFSYRGSPEHKGDKKRNISLEDYEVLFKDKKCDFYSLQFDNNEDLKQYQNKYENIYDCKPYIKDFNDTANIVNKLDFIITIDSSLAHLCGSIGVKTYLILRKNSEWRWLLNTNKSIWYNSLEILREENQSLKDILFKLKNLNIDCK